MKALDYKSSNIMKAERELRVNFIPALQSLQAELGIYTIFFLLKAGGYSDDEATNAIDEGIDKSLEAIMEGIGNAGFLPQESRVKVKMAVEQARTQLAKASQTEPLQNTGAASEAKPTK